jgi:hypothetical protein
MNAGAEYGSRTRQARTLERTAGMLADPDIRTAFIARGAVEPAAVTNARFGRCGHIRPHHGPAPLAHQPDAHRQRRAAARS